MPDVVDRYFVPLVVDEVDDLVAVLSDAMPIRVSREFLGSGRPGIGAE